MIGEAKRRKEAAARQPQAEDIQLTKQMTLPQRVLDNASKGMDGFWRLAEEYRQNPTSIPGATGPWNPWCYLPVNLVSGIIVRLFRGRITPDEVEDRWMLKTRLLTAVSAWRMTKGVYVFDPEIAKAIADSDVEDDLPDELFFHLPDWCPYVSTPGLKLRDGLCIHGFFAYVDDRAFANRRHFPPELNFEALIDPSLSEDSELGPLALADIEIAEVIAAEIEAGKFESANIFESADMLARVCELAREREYIHMHMNIPLGEGKFSKAFLGHIHKMAETDPDNPIHQAMADSRTADAMLVQSRLFAMIQARLGALLLYLVSDKADISPDGDSSEVRSRVVSNERRGIRNFQAPKIRPWEVGFRIGAEIRAFERRDHEAAIATGTGTSMRPHVRRAHWHSFWTGPRDQPQERRKKVRWLPPTPVNVSSSDDLVPTMHKVVK